MMLHQDGSRHEWVGGALVGPDRHHDDATSEIYSAFFVEEEGTKSSFRGLSEAIRERGLFCLLYADRASHYWHTRPRPAQGGQRTPDPGPARTRQARHRVDPGVFARGQGTVRERHVRDLAEALAAELRLAGITDMAEANRFLKGGLPGPAQARFQVTPEAEGSASSPSPATSTNPLHPGGAHRLQRQPCATSAASSSSPPSPPPPLRQGHGQGARVSRQHLGRLPRPPLPGALPGHGRTSTRQPGRRVSRFDATGRKPVDKWTAAARLTTSPQAQQNRSGQSIWYINRSTQNVFDSGGAGRRLPLPVTPGLTRGPVFREAPCRPRLDPGSPLRSVRGDRKGRPPSTVTPGLTGVQSSKRHPTARPGPRIVAARRPG